MSKEKKVTPFQFKRISKDSLDKNKTVSPKVEPKKNNTKLKKIDDTNYKPKTDQDLLRTLGDKDSLSTIEEKFAVIDYVFKKDNKPNPICHLCGSRTSSTFFISHTKQKDILICSGCFQSQPTCDNCGIPTRQTGPKLSKLYCQYCKVSKECDCCSASINAKTSCRIPHVKGTYCQNCYNGANFCAVCSIPILKNESVEVGKNIICNNCYKRNISAKEAFILNEEIMDIINKHFDVKGSIHPKISTVDYEFLNPPVSNAIISNNYTLGKLVKVSNQTILAIYEGITRERAIGFFGYEYGKQLIQVLNPTLNDKNLIEGFSLWLKSYTLKNYGELDELSSIRMKLDENPYLKILSNVERLGGISRIKEKLVKGELIKK